MAVQERKCRPQSTTERDFCSRFSDLLRGRSAAAARGLAGSQALPRQKRSTRNLLMRRAASSVVRGLLGATGTVEPVALKGLAAVAPAAVAAHNVGLFLQLHKRLPLLLQRSYTLGYESLGNSTTASLKGRTILVTGSTE